MYFSSHLREGKVDIDERAGDDIGDRDREWYGGEPRIDLIDLVGLHRICHLIQVGLGQEDSYEARDNLKNQWQDEQNVSCDREGPRCLASLHGVVDAANGGEVVDEQGDI